MNTKNIIRILFLEILIMLILGNNSFAQDPQAFLRFTPSPIAKVDDSWERNDPNIVYWNEIVKISGLPV